ncbi:S41 family peptidase [Flavobacterium difficile]|uniref:PDZ domain-containing protein n=1 Tax=Flavobacterium difficile TaxID=2709659 RepID=A0ABX0I238_9FLAO|nr:S41 family peptidase [Flavobacterium difficile]NHM01233.1 hypothetical protein [Flavobacterium difficile]
MYKLLFLFFFTTFSGLSQNSENACKTVQSISSLLQTHHFQPKVLNDAFSEAVFTDFLQNIDPKNMYFIQPEIQVLNRHKNHIDDYILSSKCDFLEEIFLAYKQGLQRNLTVLNQIKKEEIGLETKDTLTFTKEARSFFENEAILKKIIKKRIVFDVYEEIAKQSKNKDSLLNVMPSLKLSTIEKIFSNEICKVENLINNPKLKDIFFADFYKSFCAYFDPHSTYLSIEEKNEFTTALNSSDTSLGILIEVNEKQELFVGKIIAGSSSYADENISVGDQILKFNTKNEEIGINCSTFEKINKLLNDAKITTVKVTFRKKNGTIYTSNLLKSKIKNYNNTAYSLVIDKGNDFKLGYLKIPSFYYDEFGNNPVSNDVFKEIFKLKENNIKGLVIDLEFNGGGSIEECVKLVGMFIDFGPVTVVSSKSDKPTILKDFNRGVVYSDPIVVLVNGLSASASEIFANTLKDYNRAIILGNATYGKGTMQTIMPLQQNINSTEFAKITIEKFYQINGLSNQRVGVQPHIEIPSLFNDLMPKEKDEKYALQNDTLNVATTFKIVQNDFSSAIKNSLERIKVHPYFKEIEEINEKVYQYVNQNERKVLLKFKNVFDDVHSLDAIYEQTEKLNTTDFNLNVLFTTYDLDTINFDEDLKIDFNDKMKAAKNNGHLFEATNILYELINKK